MTSSTDSEKSTNQPTFLSTKLNSYASENLMKTSLQNTKIISYPSTSSFTVSKSLSTEVSTTLAKSLG